MAEIEWTSEGETITQKEWAFLEALREIAEQLANLNEAINRKD